MAAVKLVRSRRRPRGRASRGTPRGRARARPPNRRGSPEAIEKRRVARVFNDILGGRGAAAHKLDGRTEKRRQRLLKELEAGKARGSRELKPLDVLQRVQELMDLGEPLSSIRKVTKVRKSAVSPESIVGVVERLHRAYSFRPEVYRFVGIGEEVLREAGVLADASKRARGQAPEAQPSEPRPPRRPDFWYESAWRARRAARNPGFRTCVLGARAREHRGRTAPLRADARRRRPTPSPRARRRRQASAPRRAVVDASGRARSPSASSRIASPAFRRTSWRRSAASRRRSRAPTSIRCSCATSSSPPAPSSAASTSSSPRRSSSRARSRARRSARPRGRIPSAAADPDGRRAPLLRREPRRASTRPERINLWRILCKTRDEAATVLEAARRDPTIAKYNDLAREHSIDKATNLRGGNLGFVGPDGASNEAGVKVDPALVKAAQTVKDGELVPQPSRRRQRLRGRLASRHGARRTGARSRSRPRRSAPRSSASAPRPPRRSSSTSSARRT